MMTTDTLHPPPWEVGFLAAAHARRGFYDLNLTGQMPVDAEALRRTGLLAVSGRLQT
jgi:hypothetical protein